MFLQLVPSTGMDVDALCHVCKTSSYTKCLDHSSNLEHAANFPTLINPTSIEPMKMNATFGRPIRLEGLEPMDLHYFVCWVRFRPQNRPRIGTMDQKLKIGQFPDWPVRSIRNQDDFQKYQSETRMISKNAIKPQIKIRMIPKMI